MKQWSPPVAVEDHVGRVVQYADGHLSRDADVTLTEEQYKEMAQGYRCCRCYGMLDTAFPETCGFPGCDGYPNGFPVRERQRKVMEEEFDGLKWIGPSRAMYERAQTPVEPFKATKTGILVPRNVKE